MIKVYIYPFSNKELNDKMFLPGDCANIFNSRDNVQLLVFKHLKEACLREGIEIHTCDFFEINKKIKSIHIFMWQWPFEHLIHNNNVVLGAYHIWESPVNVRNYPADQFNILHRISQVFHRVYAVPTLEGIRSALPTLPSSLPIKKAFLHQPYNGVVEPFWSRRDRKFLTLIANFNLCSLKKLELYTERIRAIQFFADKGLELYGNNWGQVETYKKLSPNIMFTNLRKLRGSAKRGTLHGELLSLVSSSAILKSWTGHSAPYKLQTLSEYQFCICYESSMFEGFVTEKIFDCMVSGTIPIYLGAPDISKYVPKECYIDKRDFASYQLLHDFLISLSPSEVNRYRLAAKSYFDSDMYKPFSKEAFATQFINDINRICRLI